MTRLTFAAFFLLTGFFYVTGQPVDENNSKIDSFVDMAQQKAVADHTPQGTGFKQPASLEQSGPALMAAPETPTRNPRRGMTKLVQLAKSTTGTNEAKTSPVKMAGLAETKRNGVFGEARNQLTGGSIKPIAVTYQQRYLKAEKPVLGPRLTAVLLKRELRRVGCYGGAITGTWDDSARAGVQNYNANAGTALSSKTPTLKTLEQLQQATKVVCVKKPPVGRTIVAIANPALSKTKAVKNSNQWRTHVQRRNAAYRSAPSLDTPRPNSVNRRRVTKTLDSPRIRRKKPRAIAKKARPKRVKRIRIAKRRAKRRKTAIRSWKRTYRRKKFGFTNRGGSFSLNN